MFNFTTNEALKGGESENGVDPQHKPIASYRDNKNKNTRSTKRGRWVGKRKDSISIKWNRATVMCGPVQPTDTTFGDLIYRVNRLG